MDDEEEILRYSDISASGCAVAYNTTGNPFRLVKKPENGSLQEHNIQVAKEKRAQMMRTLALQRPRVSPVITRGTSSRRSESSRTESSCLSKTGSIVQRGMRNQTMMEFIEQKRNMYKTQLFINKKKAELQNLEKIKEQSINDIKKEHDNNVSQMYENKATLNKLQVELTNIRRKQAENSQNYLQQCKKLEQLEISVRSTKEIISKNEKMHDSYTSYSDFLEQILPRGIDDKFSYFNDPMVLIDDMHNLQSATLDLVQCYDNLVQMEGVCNYKSEQKEEMLKRAEEDIDNLINNTKFDVHELNIEDSVESARESVEKEIEKYTKIIKQVFEECFGAKTSMTPLSMLQEIEKSIVNMIKLQENIDPKILDCVMSEKEIEREQKERYDRRERRDQEQAKKKEETLKMATREIPRRDKKHPIQRMLPSVLAHNDDSEHKRMTAELKAEERLLFEDN